MPREQRLFDSFRTREYPEPLPTLQAFTKEVDAVRAHNLEAIRRQALLRGWIIILAIVGPIIAGVVLALLAAV